MTTKSDFETIKDLEKLGQSVQALFSQCQSLLQEANCIDKSLKDLRPIKQQLEALDGPSGVVHLWGQFQQMQASLQTLQTRHQQLLTETQKSEKQLQEKTDLVESLNKIVDRTEGQINQLQVLLAEYPELSELVVSCQELPELQSAIGRAQEVYQSITLHHQRLQQLHQIHAHASTEINTAINNAKQQTTIINNLIAKIPDLSESISLIDQSQQIQISLQNSFSSYHLLDQDFQAKTAGAEEILQEYQSILQKLNISKETIDHQLTQVSHLPYDVNRLRKLARFVNWKIQAIAIIWGSAVLTSVALSAWLNQILR